MRFHERTYGKNFRYQDFAPMFKAELFDPNQWAELFKRSGAKYIVPTSKHHEGFCLWPSKESWNWNSVDIGAHRDLLGDLTKAVRAKRLKCGFYYSLYEWYNPIYRHEFKRYVDEHFLPQLKDAVTRYTPDIIFADGEWEHTSSEWKSPEILAWMFNESPVKDSIVINDRWGSDTRSEHGGYYTTEYGLFAPKKMTADHPWEENRGIGASFGYNRNEDIDDYRSPQELIDLLTTTVGQGGNLLLDIGPDADGTIPVIMQERLLQIGEWLKVNGEAIYSSRSYRTWHEGEKIRFTMSKDGKYLYMIYLNSLDRVIRTNIASPPAGSEIWLLGVDGPLQWHRDKQEIAIEIPDSIIAHKPCNYAWTFRMENSKYAEEPEILYSSQISDSPIRVGLKTATSGAVIRYTLDGTEPSEDSQVFAQEIIIGKHAVLKAKAMKEGIAPSLTAKTIFTVYDKKKNGLSCSYYEGTWDSLPNFDMLRVIRKERTYTTDLNTLKHREENFGLVYHGKIDIETGGDYTFYLTSDDGSQLFIDDKRIVDNDGLHAPSEKSGSVHLEKGKHILWILFFQKGYGASLKVEYSGPGIEKQEIPASILFVE